ncbi:MAG: alternative ribosome rescue aminoacyl-tRNA hydrolase ArfB [Corynebacterium sp.]|uniref:alternative ribosome rescue aminoacyl-tRNA hydrolase ArfB n=1 Tax=Corynebacterium sp. TaxID=1720 RepID=UPI0026E01B9F|nr:alternative ribosome rescue aminoacyl-tRNA hydrolase ArfB [Corynebacterium sp.]MDO5668623.1 alternative ribosome rescue aminoacyl-tRNA hydrolase ArfB [Corynebacterium sp.]
MDPLVLDPGPGIPDGLSIPAADLREQFARSSGPGGQGVNTTDSKVQLSLDLATTSALDERLRRRALHHLAHRLDGTVLQVQASEHRSQLRNRAQARRRLATLLREALAPPPPPRRRTKPTKGSMRRRLAAKRRRSDLKSTRRKPEQSGE